MVNEKVTASGLEVQINVNDGPQKAVTELGPIRRTWLCLTGLVLGLISRVRNFLEKAWSVGADDPRKVIHCFKVGLALTVVSLFYYMRPLYQGLGGNAMWAVLTVVVVFEFTVGATLYKGINRAAGTSLAGALAVGLHWVASQSGEEFEAIILRTSVFLIATAATFSRFIPVVKARFDYGAMIFILTFSLVSVSGYRVDQLFELAHRRFSTVVIGTSMCLLISMLICPVWAGQDLHLLVIRNMEKIAYSLDGCVSEYFKDNTSVMDDDEEYRNKILGYKSVLISKGSEASLANFAIWEPPHGRFSFRHPWNQYLKIGTLIRNCAYCIDALGGCNYSEIQAPELIKKHLSSHCMRLSSHSATVLKELAVITKTMKKSSTIEFSVAEMNSAVQDLRNAMEMKCLPTQIIQPTLTSVKETMDLTLTMTTTIPVLEVLPLITVTSLLIEISARIGEIVNAVDELASMTGFTKPAEDENKPRQIKPVNSDDQGVQQETMKALQQV